MKLKLLNIVGVSTWRKLISRNVVWAKLIVLAAFVVIGVAGFLLAPKHQPVPVAIKNSSAHTKPAEKPVPTPVVVQASDPVAEPIPAQTNVARPGNTTPAKTTQSPHSLFFSQSTMTVYKATPGPGMKQQVPTTASVTMYASDGAAIGQPVGAHAAGTFLPVGPDPGPFKSSWPMLINPSYVDPGTYTYDFNATTAKSVTYFGSVQVVVKPIPIFTVSATGFAIQAVGDQVDVNFTGGIGPGFDLSQVAGYMPKVTISISNTSCTVDLASPDADPACEGNVDSDLPPGTYSASCTFENLFQRITVQGTAYVS